MTDGISAKTEETARLAGDAVQASLVPKLASEKTASLTAEVFGPAPSDLGVDIPDALRAFVETGQGHLLVEALRRKPALYWHPIVADHIFHMRKVEAGVYGDELVDAGRRQLEEVLSAHTDTMVLRDRVRWSPRPRKRGVAGGIKNPRPRTPADDSIPPAELFRAYSALHQGFRMQRAKLQRLPGDVTKDRRVERVTCTAIDVLGASAINWSGYLVWETPDGNDSLTIVTAVDARERWDIDLHPVVRTTLSERRSRDGLPASLAYAVLAALLGQRPIRIRNAVENYRRKHR